MRSIVRHTMAAAWIVTLFCFFSGVGPAFAEYPIVVTDVAGRTVSLPGPAKRIILAQGRHLPALALIHPDPVSILVGWQTDMQRQDPATYNAFRRKFPALDKVEIVGDGTKGSLSLERVISLRPDVVIMSRYVAGTDDEFRAKGSIVSLLEQADIPVVIVDFFVDPLRDTADSISILGKVMGRERQAHTLLHFYEEHLRKLTDTIAKHRPARPSVFMHAHAGGRECCYSSGKGTFDDFINFAGGYNIAVDKIPGSTGQISLEYLIFKDPDIYIATGGPNLASSGGLVLGTDIKPSNALSRFNEILSRPGISKLTAVTSGRARALWHMFNDSPSHIVALEWLAKWFHPELFKDLDPNETMRHLNTYSAVPLEGTFWIEHR